MNFLEDLLDIIEEIDQLEATTETDSSFGTQIRGTQIGQDTETQITTLITGETVTLIRQVNNYLRLDLESGTSYSIQINDEGKEFNIIIGSGSTSTITIKQSGG